MEILWTGPGSLPWLLMHDGFGTERRISPRRKVPSERTLRGFPFFKAFPEKVLFSVRRIKVMGYITGYRRSGSNGRGALRFLEICGASSFSSFFMLTWHAGRNLVLNETLPVRIFKLHFLRMVRFFRILPANIRGKTVNSGPEMFGARESSATAVHSASCFLPEISCKGSFLRRQIGSGLS